LGVGTQNTKTLSLAGGHAETEGRRPVGVRTAALGRGIRRANAGQSGVAIRIPQLDQRFDRRAAARERGAVLGDIWLADRVDSLWCQSRCLVTFLAFSITHGSSPIAPCQGRRMR